MLQAGIKTRVTLHESDILLKSSHFYISDGIFYS